MNTKRILVSSIAAVAAVAGVATTAAARDTGKIKSDSMLGVPAAMTGAAGNIRGVNGGGLPWSIGEAKITVMASGKVDVEFEDLIFTAGPPAGTNTIPNMAVVVSCLDAENQPINVTSDPFPVTVATADDPGGDAEAKLRLDLPSPCFAPIAMITNSSGAVWFAVDGF